MKIVSIATLAALVVSICISCNSKTESNRQNDNLSKSVSNETNQMFDAGDSAVVADKYKKEQKKDQASTGQGHFADKTPQKADWDKKIIKSASLQIKVNEYTSFNDRVHKNIKEFGGYVSNEEQNESDYKIENIMSIKVPVDQFEHAVSDLVKSDEKIIEKKITSDNVTTEMIDTKSRIEAKKQIRLRYLDLLKQAKNMDEILLVQNEINDIQEQLESAAGRVEYLNHATAFSTINLTFYQVLNPTANDEGEPTFLHKISAAFSEGLKWIGNLTVGLISIWPLWIAGIFGLLVIKRIRSPRNKMVS